MQFEVESAAASFLFAVTDNMGAYTRKEYRSLWTLHLIYHFSAVCGILPHQICVWTYGLLRGHLFKPGKYGQFTRVNENSLFFR